MEVLCSALAVGHKGRQALEIAGCITRAKKDRYRLSLHTRRDGEALQRSLLADPPQQDTLHDLCRDRPLSGAVFVAKASHFDKGVS